MYLDFLLKRKQKSKKAAIDRVTPTVLSSKERRGHRQDRRNKVDRRTSGRTNYLGVSKRITIDRRGLKTERRSLAQSRVA